MYIYRKDFNMVIPDNEETYLCLLSGIIESVDELSSLQITRFPRGYRFRLSPSLPRYNNLLIEEILKFNNLFGVQLDLSKSIKSTGTVFFSIHM